MMVVSNLLRKSDRAGASPRLWGAAPSFGPPEVIEQKKMRASS